MKLETQHTLARIKDALAFAIKMSGEPEIRMSKAAARGYLMDLQDALKAEEKPAKRRSEPRWLETADF